MYFSWVHQIHTNKSDFWISKNQKLLITPSIMELEPFWHHFWTFSFFKLFDLKIHFLGKKNQKQNNHSNVNLMINSEEKTAISLAWIWFYVKITMDWWRFSKNHKPEIFYHILDGSTEFTQVNQNFKYKKTKNCS